jgi:uncharacterized protein YndB with AHSA1/START domain
VRRARGRSLIQSSGAGELPVSRPAVSQHQRVLKEAGLVTDRADGTRRIYQIRHQGVQAIHGYLDQMWGQAMAAFQAEARRVAGQAPPGTPKSAQKIGNLACDPPHRIVVAWQITAHPDAWVYDPDLSRASEFEVNFREQPDGQTLVELEHRNIGRHGPGAAGIRQGVSGPGGWPDILDSYATVAASRCGEQEGPFSDEILQLDQFGRGLELLAGKVWCGPVVAR